MIVTLTNEQREGNMMSKEYELLGNFGTGNYLTDLGKLSLASINGAELDLHSAHEFDPEYLDALSADSDSDPSDLPDHEPIIPEVTEDMSY